MGVGSRSPLFLVWTILASTLVVSGCSMQAIYSTDVQAVRAAIAAGEDPNRRSLNGHTPLTRLLSNGIREKSGEESLLDDPSLMQDAALVDVAKTLLDAGADPNLLGGGTTALWLAASACRVEVVRLLLDRGADPMAYQWSRGSILDAVMKCTRVVESERITGMVLDQVDRVRGHDVMAAYATQRTEARYSPLTYAVWIDRPGVVAAILARSVDVNVPFFATNDPTHPFAGWTPLHVARAMGRGDMAEALLRCGARSDLLSSRGETPSMVGGRYAEEEGFGVLLARSATNTVQMQVAGGGSNPVAAYRNGQKTLSSAMERMTRNAPLEPGNRSGPIPPGWKGLQDAAQKCRR